MREFYSVDSFDKGSNKVFIIELGPNDKLVVGDEIVLDGEKKVVVDRWSYGAQSGLRQVGVVAEEAA